MGMGVGEGKGDLGEGRGRLVRGVARHSAAATEM